MKSLVRETPALARTPWLVLRTPKVSLRLDRRVPPVLLVLLVAIAAVMVVNISVGEYKVPLLDVVKTLLHMSDANPDYDFIVNTLRLPRMLVAVLVGMALAVSGAILQGVTRNSLADPSIIGITGGATLVAVVLIVAVKNVPAGILPFAAFGGGVVMALLIYLLAWRGGDSPMRLILVGIGLEAVVGAATSLMITFGQTYDVQAALIWLSGSVYGRSWEEFWPLLPWVVVLIPVALLLARRLNAINLGEEVARGLGSRLELDRALLLLTAVALAGCTVAAAGTIGFVGLMAPHVARRLVGPSHEGLIPVAALIGGLLVVTADLIGRTIIAPSEVPAGLVTAVIGAPFFVYLLWRRRDS